MRVFFASFLLLSLTAVAADKGVSWGDPSNGFRFGFALNRASDPGKLFLVFENVGTVERDLLLGGRTGAGPMYAFTYAAAAPRRAPCDLLYLGGANFVAGYVEPLLVRLAPGEQYQLALPMRDFLCVIDRKDIRLPALLRSGYRVRGYLETTPKSAKWSRSQKAWTGRMQTGELSY